MSDENFQMVARLRDEFSKVMDNISRNTLKQAGRMRDELKKVSTPFTKLGNVLKNAGSEIGTFFKRFGPGILIVTGLTKAFTALGASIEFVRKATTDFEKTMSTVKAILVPTSQDFVLLSEKAKQLGRTTSFTATQAGEAFVELGKLGFKTGEILASVNDVLNIAVIGQTDLAFAAKVTATTINQFNLEADAAGQLSDLMAKAFTTSALDLEKFANSMKFVGKTAELLNLDVRDTTAMLAILADNGIEASMAGTSLNQAMIQLSNPVSKANKFLRTLEVTADDFIGKMKILRDQNIDVGETFGLLDVRAARALNVLFQGLEDVEAFRKSLDDTSEAAQKYADTMLDNVAGATIILESAQEGLALALGEAFGADKQKRIEKITENVSELTVFVERFSDRIEILGNAWNSILTWISNVGMKIIKDFLGIWIGAEIYIKKYTIAMKEAEITVMEIANSVKNTLGLEAFNDSALDAKKELTKMREELKLLEIESAKLVLGDFKKEGKEKKKSTELVAAEKEIDKLKSKLDKVNKDALKSRRQLTEDEKKELEQKAKAAQDVMEEIRLSRLKGEELELAELINLGKERRAILKAAGVSEIELDRWLMDEKKRIRDEYIEEDFRIKAQSVVKEQKISEDVNKIIQNSYKEQKASQQKSLKDSADRIKKEEEFRKVQQEGFWETANVASQSFSIITRGMFKSAKAQKKIAMAESIIHGALAVQKALSSGGPPWNYIQAALVGIAAGVQTATIANQKFAKGGLITQPTMALMGEAGAEGVLNNRALNTIGVGGLNALNSGQEMNKTVVNDIAYSPVFHINGQSDDLQGTLMKDKERFARFFKDEIVEKGYLN